MSFKNVVVEIKKPDLTPEICLKCKNFKYFFSPVPNVCELHCKKGNKCFLADKPFACGQFKPKRRK